MTKRPSLRLHHGRKTESEEKMLNYVYSLSSDPNFKKKVAQIRKKYKIPSQGFKGVSYGIGPTGTEYAETPKILIGTKFDEDVDALSQEYFLDIIWGMFIGNYVKYNDFNATGTPEGPAFEVIDLNGYLNGPFTYFGDPKLEKKEGLWYVRELAKTKPIAILLHPYASQRNIIDYIKKLYKSDILPLQDRLKNKDVRMETVRSKNSYVKERNQFIYDHRDLPRKKLVSLVADTFGEILDLTYISKIISDMEKSQ